MLSLKGEIKTHLRQSQKFALRHPEMMCMFVLFEQRGVKHGRIIRGQRDRASVAKERRKGMILDLRFRAAQLQSQGACANVALRADFERNSTVGEKVHKRGVIHRGDSVADASHAEEFDGLSNLLWSADLAGMNQPVQPQRRGLV